jgi:hypothetical protein
VGRVVPGPQQDVRLDLVSNVYQHRLYGFAREITEVGAPTPLPSALGFRYLVGNRGVCCIISPLRLYTSRPGGIAHVHHFQVRLFLPLIGAYNLFRKSFDLSSSGLPLSICWHRPLHDDSSSLVHRKTVDQAWPHVSPTRGDRQSVRFHQHISRC